MGVGITAGMPPVGCSPPPDPPTGAVPPLPTGGAPEVPLVGG